MPDESALFVRYHATRDPAVRDQLIERFLPLARSIALRFSSRRDTLEDLLQVATIGLINAVDRFDPARGVAFSTYAVPTISGEIKRYFRDRTWSVRPPRALQELALRVDAAVIELSEDMRAPTLDELACKLDEPQELVLEALHAHHARYAVSMQAQLGSDDDDGAARLEDRIGFDDDSYEMAEERVVLERLLRMVTDRDRRVLRMHFELDMTQREIGDVLGVSQMQVSRIIRHALQRMRLGAARSEELLVKA
ncbi:MAG TPA: SigB/SigF/SigG family RNA polymerase sigma factor [Solirubrobacteraceae bacterium]|nr:SigB/SigF/SigG family RNA polymerase sigma factor [Solirubrobacteraceae bacterium]